MTASREASYLYEMLNNMKSLQNDFNGGIGIVTHSRGNLVGAKLMTMMGRENLAASRAVTKESSKMKVNLPWRVFSYWNLNGFVSYTTVSFLNLKNVLFDPKKVSQVKDMPLTQKETYEYIISSLELLDLELEIKLLRNQELHQDRNPEELQELLKSYQLLEAKLSAIKQSFMPSMEGVAEGNFVNYVMSNYEQMIKEMNIDLGGKERGLRKREEASMHAMMEGLRHIVKVSVTKEGRESFTNRNTMFPESVIGDFYKFNQEGYPGLPKKISVIMGDKDNIVPVRLTEHLLSAARRKNSKTSAIRSRILKSTHYGPEEKPVRDLMGRAMSVEVTEPIEQLIITHEVFTGSKTMGVAKRENTSKKSELKSFQRQCLGHYAP